MGENGQLRNGVANALSLMYVAVCRTIVLPHMEATGFQNFLAFLTNPATGGRGDCLLVCVKFYVPSARHYG